MRSHCNRNEDVPGKPTVSVYLHMHGTEPYLHVDLSRSVMRALSQLLYSAILEVPPAGSRVEVMQSACTGFGNWT